MLLNPIEHPYLRSYSAGQEIPHPLRHLKIHYRVRRSLSLILCWITWVQSISSYPSSLRSTLLSLHLCQSFPSGLFPLGVPTKILHWFLSYAFYRLYHFIPDFITIIIFGEHFLCGNQFISSHLIYSCPSIYGSTAFVDLGRFFSFLIYTQSVGLLGQGISPLQGRYLHRTTWTQNKRTQTTMPRVEFDP
jgi:hypothetical protein